MTLTALVDLDADVLRRAADGDAAAFTRLYERHYARILAFCARMRGDRQRAEDLAQEVFLRAWRGIGSFRAEAKFSTWLHRIAANVAISEMRSHELDTIEIDDVAVDWFPGTDIDMERAIASLPPRARLTLLLRIEGHSYDEIAEMTGVTTGTVKQQVHRARALLQERLG